MERSLLGGFLGHVHFNNRALLDRYVLEGPEDAILVFRGDGLQYTPWRAESPFQVPGVPSTGT